MVPKHRLILLLSIIGIESFLDLIISKSLSLSSSIRENISEYYEIYSLILINLESFMMSENDYYNLLNLSLSNDFNY